MSVVIFPASKPGKESPAGPELGDCCGLRPIELTWPRHPFIVGVICQNPACPNAIRGTLACDVDIVEKWERYRFGPGVKHYSITQEHNPDILATGDTLRYKSDQKPAVGDTLTFQGHTVTVTTVKPIQDYHKHNWEVRIEGEGMPEIRELLTYKVMKRES